MSSVARSKNCRSADCSTLSYSAPTANGGRNRPTACDHNSAVQRDTLIDFFRDLVAIRGEFLVYDDGYRRRAHTLRGGRARRARLRGAARARRACSKGDKVVFWGENRPEWIACYWGCLLSGIIVVPIDYRSSAEFVARVRALVDARARARRRGRARTAAAGHAFQHVWPFADVDWRAEGLRAEAAMAEPGPMPDVPDLARRRHSDHLHVGRDGRTERRRHPPPQRAGQHRAGRARGHEVPRVRAAVSSAALPQPAAAQPHVRAVDGHEHPADGARHGHLHAQLQPARHPAADQVAPRLGARVRAEDPRRAARARASVRFRKRPSRRRQASPFPAGGGATAACTARSASSSGRSSSARRRCRPTLEEFWRRLGFAVIQGYGLTETAPIVTLNHPFKTSKGSVGTPIAGRRDPHRRRRRDPRARRERHVRLLRRRTPSARRPSPATPADPR